MNLKPLKSAPRKRKSATQATKTVPRKKRKLDPCSPPKDKVRKRVLPVKRKKKKKNAIRVQGKHVHPTAREEVLV